MPVTNPLGANDPKNPPTPSGQEVANLLECSAIGVAWIGPDGYISRANSAEAAMLGLDLGEYIGRRAADFFVPGEAITEILKEVAAGTTVRHRPIQKTGKDGSLRDVSITALGVFESGRFLHAVCLSIQSAGHEGTGGAGPLLASIIESSTDAIVSKTLDGTILSWNAGATRLFEYTAEEAIGSKITLIIPPELVHEEEVILSRIRQGERIEHFETVRVTKSGRRLDISLTVSPVRDRSGRIVAASKVARDITDRKRAERILRESQAQLAAEAAALIRLNKATSRLWRARTRSQGIDEMLTATMELLSADLGSVHLLDPAKRVLSSAAARGFREEFVAAFREVALDEDFALSRALRLGQPVWVEDADLSLTVLRRMAQKEGVKAVQCTPLLSSDGTAVGVISAFFYSPRRPSSLDLQRMELYAQQAAEFIEACRTEETLRERDHRLRLALESGRMGTWDWSIATNRITWSPTLESIHGFSPGAFPGTFEAFQSEIHPDDKQRVLRSLAESLEGKPHRVEYRIVRRDRSIRWVEGTGALMLDASGTPSHMIGVCADITARKAAEETIRALLRISERLNSTLDLEALLDVLTQEAISLVGANAGVAGLHTDRGMVCRKYWQNGKALPLEYCWPPMHGLPGWLITHKIPYLTNDALHDEQIVQELCKQFDVRSALSTPIVSADRQLLGFFEIHNKEGGFTESDREKLLAVSHSAAIAIQNALAYERAQRTEQILRESEQRFASFMQHLPGLAWIKDREGRYVYVNDAAERAFRTPRAQLYGFRDDDVFASNTASQFRENDQRALLSAGGIQTVETLEHEDGVHHSLVHKFPIFDNRGEVGLIGGMAIDITERIRAEDALRQSEERYRAVVESQAEMVCRFKVDGEIEFANEAYARALGSSPAVLAKSDFWNFIPAEERASVRAMLNRLTPEAPEIRVENRFLAHGGEKWTLWTNRALAFDADGRVSEAQATGIDITDRKKAEEALRRANEDLERFAYSASHDLQEPIRNIALAAEMLAHHNQSRLDPNGLSQLVFIQESARRMTELIRDLLAYTQIVSIEETVPREANATTALEKALASLSAFIVETEAKVISEPLPSVRMPEIQLQQVFQNLISNAIKYRKDDQKPIMRIRADRKGAEWLVSVQDNGIGIPPEYHERIFGVFKRLHGYGKYAGSGIGLAICKRIVERHGGRIWVESDGTTGSTFYFALPAESGL